MSSEIMSDDKDVKDVKDNTPENKGKKKYGGKGKGRRFKKNDNKSKESSETLRSDNDVSWYLKDPTYASSVGKLMYSRPTGDNLPQLFNLNMKQTSATDPGIMVFEDMMTWGGMDGDYPYVERDYSGQYLSLNTIGTKIMQFMQTFNSRSYTYQKSDVLKYLMCVDQLAVLLTEAGRVYKFAYSLSSENRYYKNIVDALGWNSNNVIKNLANFKSYIVLFNSQFNRLYIPNLFSMSQAHVQHYSHVYLDQPSIKGQLFAYVPHGWWYYSEKRGDLNYVSAMSLGDAGTNDDYLDWRYGYRTVEKWCKLMEYTLNKVYNSETFAKIQSDMLRSFGMNSLSLLAIDLETQAVPIVDPEESLKLHNAICVQGFQDDLYTWTLKTVGDVQSSETIWTPRDDWDASTYKKSLTLPDEAYRAIGTVNESKLTPSSMVYRDNAFISGDLMCLISDQVAGESPMITTNPGKFGIYAGWSKKLKEYKTKSYLLDLPAPLNSDPATVVLQHVYRNVINDKKLTTSWNNSSTYTQVDSVYSTMACGPFVIGYGHLISLGLTTDVCTDLDFHWFNNFNDDLHSAVFNSSLSHLVADKAWTQDFIIHAESSMGDNESVAGDIASLLTTYFDEWNNLPMMICYWKCGFDTSIKDILTGIKWDTSNVIEESDRDMNKILRAIILSLLTVSMPGGGNRNDEKEYQPRH